MQNSPWPADRVERRPIAALVPDARNARTHSAEQVSQIAASMREWGWTNPVLVDDDGRIIAGHGRVLAAVEIGFSDVPVMVAEGWTEAQKRAYALADNKLALNAGWDLDQLAEELRGLEEWGFDRSLTGFDLEEIDKLTKSGAPEQFAEYGDEINVTHTCPRCGFRWSGGSSEKTENGQAAIPNSDNGRDRGDTG
jgi:ParB-like chromosome segregation protein Spo0J